MKNLVFPFILLLLFAGNAAAQNTLPDFSVKNLGGKIIVSWKNAYRVKVANLNIQRSYDSIRNFTTIGTVINPESQENGYFDANPPYNKMYYRLFISFEGGSFLFTKSQTPLKDIPVTIVKTADGRDSIVQTQPVELMPWQINPMLDSNITVAPVPGAAPKSQRIFMGKDDVVLDLPYAGTKKYIVKFFDDNNKMIFQLTNLKEQYLILDKVNFVRSGNYSFEIYEDGIMIEKNFVIIPKDAKKQ